MRALLDSIVLSNSLGLDLLYTVALPGRPLEVYAGGGAGIVWVPIVGTPFVAVHATAGLEYLTGRLGSYGEVQPLLPVIGTEGGPVLIKLRSGLNTYF